MDDEDVKPDPALLAQPLQYILIEGTNGYVQTLPAQSTTTSISATISTVPQSSNASASNNTNVRSSIAIAPKITTDKYSTTTKTVSKLIGFFKYKR